jgi:3-dehydroquinate synthase
VNANIITDLQRSTIIYDRTLWDDLKSDVDEFEIVQKSIAVKASVVNNDYHEKGERKILNFGHTIGHALESYALTNRIDLLHGEAIVTGMIVEAELAFDAGLLSQVAKSEIVNVLCNKFGQPMLTKVDFNLMTEFLLQDKKNTHQICFSLPTEIGKCEINQFFSLEEIKKASSSYIEWL